MLENVACQACCSRGERLVGCVERKKRKRLRAKALLLETYQALAIELIASELDTQIWMR
jgi:hypothetical protein